MCPASDHLEPTMSGERNPESSKKVIPFAPNKAYRQEPRDDGDPVDRSGQAIIELLQQAAETANSNCDRAMELAHKLSVQLRAAEERIRELESDTNHFHDRAQRAEKWLARIYKDIEDKFFNPESGRFEQR
jgi:exonuclease VII small subunit